MRPRLSVSTVQCVSIAMAIALGVVFIISTEGLAWRRSNQRPWSGSLQITCAILGSCCIIASYWLEKVRILELKLARGVAILLMGTCWLDFLFIPHLPFCGEDAGRVKCASNLKQIYNAIVIYAEQNGQSLPPDLGSLLAVADISADIFVCPKSTNTVAPDGFPKDERLDRSRHCSYTYFGQGLKFPLSDQTVLAYDPLKNHDSDGANVLFGNGHVDFCTPKQLKECLATPATKRTTESTLPHSD